MAISVDEQKAKFKNVIRTAGVEEALPIDDYLRSIDQMIVDICQTRDTLIPAIGSGTAPRDLIRRLAMEFYYLGKWMTPDFAIFIANAPDAYSLTIGAFRALRALVPELRRRSRLPARPESRADEMGVVPDDGHHG